jgi:hypothetical protein
MVRAKFRCMGLKQIYVQTSEQGPDGKWIPKPKTHDVVELAPVSDGANKTWSKYTPSGSISMTIDNPDAVGQFKIGGTYFVDFSPAPENEADESK